MDLIRAAFAAAWFGSVIPGALAAPVSFDVLLTAQAISGQPAGLTSLPSFPFQLTLTLDRAALTPNLQDVDVGSGLLNIALVLGNLTYTTANYGPVLEISTDGAARLTKITFGSLYDGHRLFGITGFGWIYEETQQQLCAPGIIPTGSTCIGGFGGGSATLVQVGAALPVQEPAGLGVAAAGLAGLLALRNLPVRQRPRISPQPRLQRHRRLAREPQRPLHLVELADG